MKRFKKEDQQMPDEPKYPKPVSPEKIAVLTADLERMRAGGKTVIRGRPDLAQGPLLSALIHAELRAESRSVEYARST